MAHPAEDIAAKRIIELAHSLIAIPSVTNQEDEIADWTYEQFKALGLAGVQRLSVQDSGDTVVGWVDGPSQAPALMLNFHLDTFPVCDGWIQDPFTPWLEDGRLYGLGAHDMKGGGACVLAAVEAIVQSGIQLGGQLIVSATSDEENWSRGAHALIRSGLLEQCQTCLIPEPMPAASLAIGARGRHVFHLTFRGQASHAAYGEGVNAVVDAARVVANLGDIEPGYDERFSLGGSVCVIGFHGGGTLILVPEEAHVFVDCHILPGQSAEELAAQVEDVVRRAGIGSTYSLAWDERPTPAPGPYLLPADSPFVRTVQRNLEREVGQPVRLVLGRSVADTNHFAVHGGIATLVCGPQGGNTCQANEYVNVVSLPVVTRVLVQTAVDQLGVRR